MKKGFKRIVALVLMLAMVFTFAPSFAQEDSEKVEITFKLGESTLTINGKAVEVQTPYAVGAGVTLVPVRVITEAFGAEVGWDNATKSIPIKYPDVEILLQIGNTVAEVNGIAETLLAPPEISGQSTMVPLRFISETFGAEVTYDAVTKAITVTKEKAQEGTIVEGGIDTPNIGDSHFGWSMENPSDYTMSDRSFTGDYTYFDYDSDNYIGIIVEKTDEDYDFERDFSEMKKIASEYTLVAAEKTTEGPGIKKYYVKYKDKKETSEEIVYVKGEYRYNVFYLFSNDLKEEMKEAARVISTFRPSFFETDTHDLSTIKNGYRTYESENLGFSLNIPENFDMISDEDVENSVVFAYSDDGIYPSQISMSVYSKKETGTAKALCEEDYASNKLTMNEDITRFKGGVTEVSYANISGYEYNYSLNGESVSMEFKDVFFEIGDYVYNISLTLNPANCNVSKITTDVLKSVNATKLDPEEAGVLMRYHPEREGTYTVKGKKWSVQVPNNYQEVSSDDGGVVLSDPYSAAAVVIKIEDSGDMKNADMTDALKEVEKTIKNTAGCKLKTSVQKYSAGSYSYHGISYTVRKTDEDIMSYAHYYCALRGGKFILVTIMVPEPGYSQNTKEEYTSILSSIVIEP